QPTFTTSFDGIWIENNKIYGVDRCGILVWTSAGPGSRSDFLPGLIPAQNVTVRGNELSDVGGDAILIMGTNAPLVEKNVVRRACKKSGHPDLQGSGYASNNSAAIWFHHCIDGIIQYNQVYDCKKQQHNNDGMSFDFDYNCERCIAQYNYSHGNEGGLILIMNTATDNIVRYNISENDQSHVLFLTGNKSENNVVYNNTFYIDHGSAYVLPGATLKNNIFMAAGTGVMNFQEVSRGTFSHNCYAGNWSGYLPNETGKITHDPLFSDPGNGDEHGENLAAYALASGSPCRNAGVIIFNNGGLDILGNEVTRTNLPNMGAVQN
ncbi:MAG: right-handed parallel beta-helix repeat-containing protein, partial [Prevotellaceae bacterium]|nr:right-handed parallel beta-helix repeat-containing protein [Prevotellaceae bacterium]